MLNHHSVNVFLWWPSQDCSVYWCFFCVFFSCCSQAALRGPEKCDQLTSPSFCSSSILLLSPMHALYRTLEKQHLERMCLVNFSKWFWFNEGLPLVATCIWCLDGSLYFIPLGSLSFLLSDLCGSRALSLYPVQEARARTASWAAVWGNRHCWRVSVPV